MDRLIYSNAHSALERPRHRSLYVALLNLQRVLMLDLQRDLMLSLQRLALLRKLLVELAPP